MESKPIARTASVDLANRLVGRFLQHFAYVEMSLDSGIAKLLSLDEHVSFVVVANVPFAKKLDILFSAENLLSTMPEAERAALLKATRKRIHALNNSRIVAAHCSFEASDDGAVVFQRVVANGRLSIQEVRWTELVVEGLCVEAMEIASAVERIVAELVPYSPSLNFADPRNSMYLPLIL